MGRDISLMISAKDNYSSAITKMANVTRDFATKTDGLSKKLELLNKNKTTLQIDATKAKSELSAAQKHFKATGDEASRLDLELKQTDYNNITSNLKLVSDQAKQTERDMRNLTDEISKSQNRASSSSSKIESSQSLLSGLGKAGITQMLGDTLSGAADSLIGSALGDTMGGVVSSVISKTASGAAIGSMILPGVGTAIGAVAGAAAGAVDGAVQVFEKKNDAFKSTVQTAYEDSEKTQADMLSSGSELAAARETSRMSWTTMLGSEDSASDFYNKIQKMASTTPYGQDELNGMAQMLKVYKYDLEDILPTLTKIGDAGAALGRSSADMEAVARVLGLMKQSGKTNLEWLNIITDKGIGAVTYLAEAFQVSENEVYNMVSKGLIPGAEAAQIIADSMGKEYAGGMDLQSRTFSGLANTLQDEKNNLNAAMGEGFNSVRKTGMEEQISYLDGAAGEKMQAAYSLIGEFQASLINQQEQFERDAISAVMEGSLGTFAGTEFESRLVDMAAEYQSLMTQAAEGSTEAGAQAGALLAEAQSIAGMQYMNSEGYGLLEDANVSLINNLQADEAISGAYEHGGYTFGQELTKGIASAISDGKGIVSDALRGLATTGGTFGGGGTQYVPGFGKINAWGQKRVPYDNYPAILHQGEQLLTASEAAGQSSGGGVNVQVYGLTVREEADLDKLARKLANEIAIAQGVAIDG